MKVNKIIDLYPPIARFHVFINHEYKGIYSREELPREWYRRKCILKRMQERRGDLSLTYYCLYLNTKKGDEKIGK